MTKPQKSYCRTSRVRTSLCGAWNEAFKKNDSKSVVNESRVDEAQVNEEDAAEPIPFRLEKYDVLPQFYHENIKVKAAVTDDTVEIPDWGDSTPYPFANISGSSLWDGLAATSGFERGFTRDKYNKNSGDIYSAVAKQREIFPDMITAEDVIFHPKATITDRREGKISVSPLADARQNYSAVAKHFVAQQVYDISDDGKLIINPEYHGSILLTPNRKVSREVCKLVRILPRDVAFQCNIRSKYDCKDFMNSVFNLVQTNRLSSANIDSISIKHARVNPTYGRFSEYFSQLGCVMENGRIDVRKYISILDSGEISPESFVEDFLMPYMLCSDPSHTYVWVKVTDSRAGDCTKDLAIFNEIMKGTDVGESTEITETISGLSDDNGDIVGDTWREAFFNSMVSAKQQSSKRVLTFLDDGGSSAGKANVRDKKILILRDVINQRLTGVTREFFYIDKVEGYTRVLDYSAFFKDERLKSVLDKNATKKFNCKTISGLCIGFPFDSEIEDARRMENIKRQKINNRKFLNDYMTAYGVNARDLGGFYITLVCPVGSGDENKKYFFFRRYDSKSLPNPKVGGIEPPSDEIMSEIIPSDDNPMLSTIWYNEATSKTRGKINLPTNAHASQMSDSGRSIGYKDAEIKG